MSNLSSVNAGDMLNFSGSMIAAAVSLVGALVSVWIAYRQFRQDQAQQKSAQTAANYLALETASSDIFRYTAEKHDLISPLRGNVSSSTWEGQAKGEARSALLNLYFQSLNLFEVAARYRVQEMIEHDVFASWVAWFIELLEDTYFRAHWHSDIRANYTFYVRSIFDAGVEIFEQNLPTDSRDRKFYLKVGKIMSCPEIETWLDDIDLDRDRPPNEAREVSFAWDNREESTRAAAAFAARVIGRDTRYISHGEIQTGLSVDAHRWKNDLASLYADDFLQLGEQRDLLIGRDGSGAVVAIAVVAWEETSRCSFAVIEDMAVDPSCRSLGVGNLMIEKIEARVSQRGVRWLFLESGVRNERAHAFFERNGFGMTSHVFAKRLAN